MLLIIKNETLVFYRSCKSPAEWSKSIDIMCPEYKLAKGMVAAWTVYNPTRQMLVVA